MRSRQFAIIFFAILIFVTINLYIGWHGVIFIHFVFNTHYDSLYWTAFWLLAFSYLIARIGSRFLTDPLSRFLKIIGSYWIAAILYAVILLPIADLTAGLLNLVSVQASIYVPFLGYMVILILFVLFIRGSWNARNPVIRKLEITIPKAAGQLKQLRIAVASDLHLGTIVGNKHLKLLVDRINNLNPDLILLPGDIIDDEIEPFIRQGMAGIMKQMNSRLGIYAVLGNHEYIGGQIKEFVKQMRAIGIEVLMDCSVKIADSVYVIGRKDRAARWLGLEGRMELDALLEGVDKSFPLILMDHQPYQLDKAASSGIDVLLSGHTHGGQMAPIHWITRRLFELDQGYLQKGRMHAIVSSGYGTWGPPIRIGSRSEIIELIVRFEASN